MIIPEQFWLYDEPTRYHVWVEMIDSSTFNHPVFSVCIVPVNDTTENDIPGPEFAAILYDAFMVVLNTIGQVERCRMQWESSLSLNPAFGETDEAYLKSFVKNKGYTFVRGGGGGGGAGGGGAGGAGGGGGAGGAGGGGSSGSVDFHPEGERQNIRSARTPASQNKKNEKNGGNEI